MVRSAIVALVSFCTRRPVTILLIALILAGGSSVYAVRHFALKTDVKDLISPDVAWAQRGAQLLKDFPQQQIIVVVDAPTSELVDQAAAKLVGALRQHPERFLSVSEPGSGPFFERNGLLFLPEAQIAKVTGELRSANSFIGALAGAFLIAVINSAITFLNLDAEWQTYMVGVLTLVAAGIYSRSRKLR